MTDKLDQRIEERMNSLPKPSMSYESKQAIHSNLIEALKKESPMNRRFGSYKKLAMNLTGVAVFALLAFFIFNSIQHNNGITTGKPALSDPAENSISLQGSSYTLEDHAKYEGAYIGDNSAVTGILSELPGSNYRELIQLQTKEQPYGLTVNYGRNGENQMAGDYDDYWSDTKRVFLYNATVLFMVIHNLDTIHFYLETDSSQNTHFQFTRQEIEALVGGDVKNFIDNPELWEKEFLDPIISNDSKVNQFYSNK